MAAIIPNNINFSQFVSLLKMDWPNATIPNTVDDKNWRNVARDIMNNPDFSPHSPPAPDVYSEPIQWIKAFANAIY